MLVPGCEFGELLFCRSLWTGDQRGHRLIYSSLMAAELDLHQNSEAKRGLTLGSEYSILIRPTAITTAAVRRQLPATWDRNKRMRFSAAALHMGAATGPKHSVSFITAENAASIFGRIIAEPSLSARSAFECRFPSAFDATP